MTAWTFALARVEHDYDGEPCAQRGDDQPCTGPAGFLATTSGAGRSKSLRLCSNHAARYAGKNSIAFPLVKS